MDNEKQKKAVTEFRLNADIWGGARGALANPQRREPQTGQRLFPMMDNSATATCARKTLEFYCKPIQ
jgi:hypothetical protein